MVDRGGALDGVRSGERIRIAEQPGLALIQVSAFHGRSGAARDDLERSLGLLSPAGVGETSFDGERRILCIGPGRWWLIGVEPNGMRLDPAAGALVDQSHAWTVIELRGARVRDLLAKGCALDLNPRSIPPGACAATSCAQVAVVLHALADDRFEVHVPRSYARALFDWLEDAALEFESPDSA